MIIFLVLPGALIPLRIFAPFERNRSRGFFMRIQAGQYAAARRIQNW